jgi:16S rRNA (adenine1518-N6/adenine1519-N6)-dimethyltransferase
MVQREVAHRICALPGDSNFGYLSVFCRFFGTPELLFTLAPGAFFPKPAVHSCVFRLRVRDALDTHLSPQLWKDFFGFVKQGFGQRRKKVYNVLASTTTHKTRLRDMLGDIKGNADVRAQQLDVDEWLRLYASCTAEGIR